MKLIRPFLAVTSVFLAASALQPLHAQTPGQPNGQQEEEENDNVSDESDPSHRRFWQARVPGGHYMVALDRISNISIHEYLLDGNFVVNEVTIDTTGRALARFYYIEPLADSSGRTEITRVIDKGRELVERAGQRANTNAHEMAQKNYPTTTHAGMIEYRLLDLRDLDALYGSVKTAWETGKGRRLTIR